MQYTPIIDAMGAEEDGHDLPSSTSIRLDWYLKMSTDTTMSRSRNVSYWEMESTGKRTSTSSTKPIQMPRKNIFIV